MGWIQRLSDGLTKTRDKVRLSVDRLMGRGPSPEELDELETSLIAADIGIRTVDRFMSRLRQSGGSGGADGVLGMLKTTLLDTLQSCEGESLSRLIERGPRPFVVLAVGVNGVGKTTTLQASATDLTAWEETLVGRCGYVSRRCNRAARNVGQSYRGGSDSAPTWRRSRRSRI